MGDQCNHFLLMGRLVVNLQSLEFALRAFLYNDEIGWKKKNTEPEFLEKIKEGDVVPENAFTNYDSLGELIDNYNDKVHRCDSNLCVDKDLVSIRDALAHGRIASSSPSISVPSKLVKYAKPQNGSVRITNCITMSREWFDKQIKLVYLNILKVSKANKMLSGWQPQAQLGDG